MKKLKNKGITIISLIITIIIMLILVGVTVQIVIDSNLIGEAEGSKEKAEHATEREKLDMAVYEYTIEKYNNKRTLKEVLQQNFGEQNVTENENETITVILADGSRYKVWTDGKIKKIQGVTILEVYDKNGDNPLDENYNKDKLHIGDFVIYDAGTWETQEIEQIKVGQNNNLVGVSSDKPTQNFQFGGFSAGTSRNCNDEATSWRVFDVDEETGVAILISAGCPEYYFLQNNNNDGYVSEFILTGNVNSGAPSSINADNYKIRNWDSYVNTEQSAVSATVLSKEMLENWFQKYTGNQLGYGDDNGAFTALIGKQYETLIKLDENYMLAEAYGDKLLYCYYSDGDNLNNYSWYACGVRICVELGSEAEVSEKPIDTVTVTNRDGGTSECNVWKIY